MATEKEICSLALRRLGQATGLVSLGENSAYAELAASSYPIVRDALLERHAWNFATTRERLALMTDKPIGWAYMYAAPTDMLRVLTIQGDAPITYWDDEAWVVEMHGPTQVIETNIANAVCKFVRREINAKRFSAGFTDALAWHLSASLAGPVIKSETGMTVAQRLLQTAQYFERAAIAADVNQRHQKSYRPDAPWIDFDLVTTSTNRLLQSTDDLIRDVFFQR